MTTGNSGLTSRERMLLAINHEEADHVPLWINFGWEMNAPRTVNLFPERWSLFFPEPSWDTQFDRCHELLGLGLDDMLTISPPPPSIHSDVTTTFRSSKSVDDRYPVLTKEYHTPEGTLKTEIWHTEDFPHENDIPLFSDYNIPRATKHLIATVDDLNKLKFLLNPPGKKNVEIFHNKAKELKSFALKEGVLIVGEGGVLGDGAAWLCGQMDLLLYAVDQPDMVRDLLALIQQMDINRTELLLEGGVDVVIHRGWYENFNFWPPGKYREFLLPLIKEQARIVHQAGAKFAYVMTTGIMAAPEIFLEMDIDILFHVDPIQDNIKVDLAKLKRLIGNRICIVGGVNSYLTLERGSDQDIENAVTSAIDTLAPGGGFILEPADAIMLEKEKVWRRLEVMFDTWRRRGNYKKS